MNAPANVKTDVIAAKIKFASDIQQYENHLWAFDKNVLGLVDEFHKKRYGAFLTSGDSTIAGDTRQLLYKKPNAAPETYLHSYTAFETINIPYNQESIQFKHNKTLLNNLYDTYTDFRKSGCIDGEVVDLADETIDAALRMAARKTLTHAEPLTNSVANVAASHKELLGEATVGELKSRNNESHANITSARDNISKRDIGLFVNSSPEHFRSERVFEAPLKRMKALQERCKAELDNCVKANGATDNKKLNSLEFIHSSTAKAATLIEDFMKAYTKYSMGRMQDEAHTTFSKIDKIFQQVLDNFVTKHEQYINITKRSGVPSGNGAILQA